MTETPELQYGNALCPLGHPLWLVAENYAYCINGTARPYSPWRMTEPRGEDWQWRWSSARPLSTGALAWVALFDEASKEAMLAFIQRDIDAERQAGPVATPGPTYAEYLAAVAQ